MSRLTASSKRRLAEIAARRVLAGRLTYPHTGSSAAWMGKIIAFNMFWSFPTDLIYEK